MSKEFNDYAFATVIADRFGSQERVKSITGGVFQILAGASMLLTNLVLIDLVAGLGGKIEWYGIALAVALVASGVFACRGLSISSLTVFALLDGVFCVLQLCKVNLGLGYLEIALLFLAALFLLTTPAPKIEQAHPQTISNLNPRLAVMEEKLKRLLADKIITPAEYEQKLKEIAERLDN
jgi:hypothetical protein